MALVDDYLNLLEQEREFASKYTAPFLFAIDEDSLTISCPDCGVIYYVQYERDGFLPSMVSFERPIICCGKLRR